ncbi:hypothetical protein L798_08321 [Zootermopsis nevadensis]|uniref:Uncharacterized protein n=1 Tax=Zootermopsis nevadensis TaxID=136037 RepID=A0A067QEX2_ZOONE|nr:hypothetical protein L798_08321 [Zootermopsis nevadensis]
MFVPLFYAVICRTSLAFLQVNFRKHPLMECTKSISEEHFTPGRPLVIVLPLAEEDSTSEEVGYLIEKLHKSIRWPILVLNTAYEIDSSMRKEINPHGSYIILASGACREFNKFTEHIYKQLAGLTVTDSWNPRARSVVPVMNACPNYNTTKLSRAIIII